MLIMNLIVIAIVLAVGYIWSSRGFFSALLHLACAIAGGAVAFGLWEPIAYAMLGGGDWMADIAWGMSLLIPFALVTGVLTALVNLVLKANVKCDDAVNIVGGAVCGAGVGIITAGMVAISVSMIRSRSDMFGFAPLGYDNSGVLVRESKLWFPADRLVASFYGQASRNVFATTTPLATYYPDLTDRGHMMKVGPDEAILKFAARPGDVVLRGRYTVSEAGNQDLQALLADSLEPGRAQKLVDIQGDSLPGGAYQIEGYVLTPKSGMREKGGQVIFGSGMITLVAVDQTTDESFAFQPFAMVSQAKGDDPRAGRWRFDGSKVFLGSVGGGADQPMAFEFMMPKGLMPLALYVKGARIDLTKESGEEGERVTQTAFAKYSTTNARDEGIRNGALLDVSAVATDAKIDTSLATDWRPAPNTVPEVQVTNQIPYSIILNRGGLRGMKIDDQKFIVDGNAEFFEDDKLPAGTDKDLRVERFFVDPSTVIVLVDVTPGKAFDLLSAAASQAEGAPTMVDDLEKPQRHQCVGFVYKERSKFRVRYTPGSPIVDKGDLPPLTKSRSDQQLTLIFRCSLNVKLKYFAIGNKALKQLAPVIKLDTPQNTGR